MRSLVLFLIKQKNQAKDTTQPGDRAWPFGNKKSTKHHCISLFNSSTDMPMFRSWRWLWTDFTLAKNDTKQLLILINTIERCWLDLRKVRLEREMCWRRQLISFIDPSHHSVEEFIPFHAFRSITVLRSLSVPFHPITTVLRSLCSKADPCRRIQP